MTIKEDTDAKKKEGYDDVPLIADAVIVADNDEERAIVPAKSTAIVPAKSTAMVPAKSTAMVPSRKAPPVIKVKTYSNLGRQITGLQCPYCHRQTVTTIRDVIGVGTVVAMIILAILFFPICWLPLCIPSCQRTNHYCGHAECRKKIGETSVCA